jgi:hypothetical protein
MAMSAARILHHSPAARPTVILSGAPTQNAVAHLAFHADDGRPCAALRGPGNRSKWNFVFQFDVGVTLWQDNVTGLSAAKLIQLSLSEKSPAGFKDSNPLVREGPVVTKLLALPAIALCLYALVFYVSAKPNWITSKSNNVSHDVAELPAAPTQKVVQAETAKPEPKTAAQEPKTATQEHASPANTLDSIHAELQRLSGDIKANSDKIAQTATLRPDLLKLIQDSKSSSDEAAQTARDQINALRSDQAKFLENAKDTGDKAAQSLREEVAAAQAKLAAQVSDTLKANSANSEALAQRVDAMKKDVEQVKKNFDEVRQNDSSISPTVALIAALVALVLGPFIAYKLAAARQRSGTGAA